VCIFEDPSDFLNKLMENASKQGNDRESQQRSWQHDLEFYRELIEGCAQFKRMRS